MPRDWTDLADRRLFIPDTIYNPADDTVIRRTHDPDRWEAAVASDDPVTIKMNGPWASSSSSARWIMNLMLDALRLEPGMTVLEIGTGTGWNAAIMAAAGTKVTTIEIDQELADHARTALLRAGYPDVWVICGNGEHGVPGHAPYDRVIATASMHTIPYAWVSQTTDGGRIVLPYSGPHHPSGLAVLTVEGSTATGQIINDQAWFMPMKGQGINQDLLRQPHKPHVRIEVRPDGQSVATQP